jgi:hypothetical protein
MPTTTFKTIPVRKIFLDADRELIFVRSEEHPNGERQPHGREGRGYQRDPWKRIAWVNDRFPLLDERKLRPIEVARRNDGMYAAIDGGGRWLMAQLAGLETLVCRVHEGLTRKQEAVLFAEFDSETYKLRSIDTFIAMIAGGEPMAVAISDAAKPYRIAVNGQGTLKAVGSLTNMYLAFAPNYARGLKLISKTCEIAAKGWGGYTDDGEVTGSPVEGKFLNAIGMVIEVAGARLDADVLIRALRNHSPNSIEQRLKRDYGDSLTTNAFAVNAAKHIASIYNRAFSNSPERKVGKTDIDNCSLWETIQEGRTFSALRRAAQLEARQAAE